MFDKYKSNERVEGASKIRGAGKMKEELKEVKKNIHIESGHPGQFSSVAQ